MLSLWKLRVGAEDYYLEQVAKGLDDYYSGAGETHGEWLGAASTALGLEHAVSADVCRFCTRLRARSCERRSPKQPTQP